MRHFQILLTLFVTLTLSGLVAESHAEPLDSLPTVELETPIHFLAPDGSDVVIESGRYQVEAAELMDSIDPR